MTNNHYIFIVCMVVGVLANFVNKWLLNAKDGKHGSLKSYLFIEYPSRTFASLVSLVSVGGGALSTQDLGTMTVYSVISWAFGLGFTIDNLVNKGGSQ